jgi:prevent-host-death family protein
LLAEAEARLVAIPLEESLSMKTLRPNPAVQRELRLFGKNRVLFNVDEDGKKSRSFWLARNAAARYSSVVRRLRRIMKVIPLSAAKANLSHYGHCCHDEPIIVTVNSVPSFQLVPLSENDDLIDSLLEHNPAFRKTLQARLNQRTISVDEAQQRL